MPKNLRQHRNKKGTFLFEAIDALKLASLAKDRAMANNPANSGKSWTPRDLRQLKELAKGDTPTRVISLKTGRSAEAVQSKACEKGVSLKPTN